MPHQTVTITLEFSTRDEEVDDIEVYQYLNELMENQMLDYTVETNNDDN